MKKLILMGCLVILVGCTDVKGATEAIKNTGLDPVKVGGYALFKCSEKDSWATKFTARRNDGAVVHGAVCKGWFKGSTVRFN